MILLKRNVNDFQIRYSIVSEEVFLFSVRTIKTDLKLCYIYLGKICTESVAQTFLSSNATTYNSSYTINANRCLTETATKILGGYVNTTSGKLLKEEDLYAPYIGAYGGTMYAYDVYLTKGMYGPYVKEFTFSRKQYSSGYWSGLNSGYQPSLIKVKKHWNR